MAPTVGEIALYQKPEGKGRKKGGEGIAYVKEGRGKKLLGLLKHHLRVIPPTLIKTKE